MTRELSDNELDQAGGGYCQTNPGHHWVNIGCTDNAWMLGEDLKGTINSAVEMGKPYY